MRLRSVSGAESVRHREPTVSITSSCKFYYHRRVRYRREEVATRLNRAITILKRRKSNLTCSFEQSITRIGKRNTRMFHIAVYNVPSLSVLHFSVRLSRNSSTREFCVSRSARHPYLPSRIFFTSCTKDISLELGPTFDQLVEHGSSIFCERNVAMMCVKLPFVYLTLAHKAVSPRNESPSYASYALLLRGEPPYVVD